MIRAERNGHEVYVWHGDQLIMKRWLDADNRPTQPTRIFNQHWPDVEVISREEPQE